MTPYAAPSYTPAIVAPPARKPASRTKPRNARWYRFSKRYLAEHPWCLHCARAGRFTLAKDVDHILTTSRGGRLYDGANLQPLCKRCHAKKTNREDGGGFGGAKT